MEKEKLKKLDSSLEAVKKKIANDLDQLEDKGSFEKYLLCSFKSYRQNRAQQKVSAWGSQKELNTSSGKNGYKKIFLNGEQTILCTEAFKINLRIYPEPVEIRLSVVFEQTGNEWQVVHLHISSSVHSTTSTKEGQSKPYASLERQLIERTERLNEALDRIKIGQTQMLKQEKLASLGQLTAGIAHEIKNPLNFITNFSELSVEFIDEISEHLEKLEKNNVTEEIDLLLKDVKSNLHKIHQHGSRADAIVKSMLLHSRGGSGKFESVDLNELIKEYVNLSFHGMRANKNPINVQIQLDLDENVGLVKLNSESLSRVILNLCKNAFDAMREKLERTGKEVAVPRPGENSMLEEYNPKLIVRSRLQQDNVVLEIEDNGPGVPDAIKDKLMTPFFTTKSGSEGTGLGLSITSEIVQAHKGILQIDSEEDKFTRFRISLPKETN